MPNEESSQKEQSQPLPPLPPDYIKNKIAELDVTKQIYESYDIYTWNESLQGTRSRPVADFDENLVQVLDRLKQSMYYHDGVGIAAPQVGIFIRAALLQLDAGLIFMVNPAIMESSLDKSGEWERCLSLPGERHNKPIFPKAMTYRPRQVEVSYFDVHGKPHVGKFEGYPSHVVQHEIDHLDGLYFIDHCSKLHRQNVLRSYKKFVKSHQGGKTC